MPSGLFPTGFIPATRAEIRAQQEALLRAEFGASLPLGDSTLLGFLVGDVSDRIGSAWEALAQIYSSWDPDKATGEPLEVVSSLTATFRADAASSTVVATLCGDDATLVAAGSLISTASTEQQFSLDADVTLAALDAWVDTTPYVVDDRVTNSSRCYVCITAGTSAASLGPVTTSADITDGTAHWRYLGEGEAAADGDWSSMLTGPIVAISGDLTAIDTPVNGWNTVLNLEDASLGRDLMADEDLRLLREAEVTAPGTGTPPAIRANLLQLDLVTVARVFFNNTDIVDSDGLPPHSCEALVVGGDDQQIWDTLWENVPIGIQTIGDQEGVVVDLEGNDQLLRFRRPTDVDVYVTVYLTKLAGSYVGDPGVKEAIAIAGNAREIGSDVFSSQVSSDAVRQSGVLKVTDVRVYTDVIATGAPWATLTAYVATPGSRSVVTNAGRSYICTTSGTSAASGGPTVTGAGIVDGTAQWRSLDTDVGITSRQRAVFDTSRTTIVAVNGAL